MKTKIEDQIKALQEIETKAYTYFEKVGEEINQLREINSQLHNDELDKIINRLDNITYPQFAPNQKVSVTAIGSGKVFKKGINVVEGKVFKSGTAPNSYRVILDKPLGDLNVLEVHSLNING